MGRECAVSELSQQSLQKRVGMGSVTQLTVLKVIRKSSELLVFLIIEILTS